MNGSRDGRGAMSRLQLPSAASRKATRTLEICHSFLNRKHRLKRRRWELEQMALIALRSY
jgi:hypothetical protein